MDNKEKFNIMQTFFYTGFYRAFILFVPFNKLRKRMGSHKQESLDKVDNDTYRIARRISSRVLFVSAKTPWESKCLCLLYTSFVIIISNIVINKYFFTRFNYRFNIIS